MSFFRRNTQEKVRVDRLWNRTIPRTSSGAASQSGVGGPLPEHDHTGTGTGGILTGAKHDAADDLLAISTPSTPAASHLSIYAKISGGIAKLFYKQSDGTEVGPLAAGGAGSKHTIRENGTDQTDRLGLNFIDPDAGAGLITDDAGGDETEVNLSLYRLEAQNHTHASPGLEGGQIAGSSLSGTPGGELGGTWASPTVDATHAGSAHHSQFHNLLSFDHADADVDGATKGSLIVGNSGAPNLWDELPVGANGQVLTADSAEAMGVKWAAAAGGGGISIGLSMALAAGAYTN